MESYDIRLRKGEAGAALAYCTVKESDAAAIRTAHELADDGDTIEVTAPATQIQPRRRPPICLGAINNCSAARIYKLLSAQDRCRHPRSCLRPRDVVSARVPRLAHMKFPASKYGYSAR